MKQSFLLSFLIIVLVFILTPSQISGSEVEIIKDGESIYKTSLAKKHVVWIVGDKVYKDQEIYHQFNLDQSVDLYDVNSIDLDLDQEINMILIDQSVQMYEANCRDKICIKKGEISNANQSIVCAPHKLVVKINGESSLDG